MIFPVAKVQTLRFVGFINITSRCTYILVTNLTKDIFWNISFPRGHLKVLHNVLIFIDLRITATLMRLKAVIHMIHCKINARSKSQNSIWSVYFLSYF